MKNLLCERLRLRNIHLFALDGLLFLVTPLIALTIRLEGDVSLTRYLEGLVIATVLLAMIKLVTLYLSGFYRKYWRYASFDELLQVCIPLFVVMASQILVFRGSWLSQTALKTLPQSLPLIDGLVSVIALMGLRFGSVALERFQNRNNHTSWSDRVLIVGAGCAGISLAQQMQQDHRLGFAPIAFIDDDPVKRNLRIIGLPVLGNRYKIPYIVRSLKIGKVVIAIPSAPDSVICKIREICERAGVPTTTLPGVNQLLSNLIQQNHSREVQIEDLLLRDPIQTDGHRVAQLLKGRRVLVTGGGGSIGSELCRQILKAQPAEIVLLGKGENSIFLIQQELEQWLQDCRSRHQTPLPRLTTCIADVRSRSRLDYMMAQIKPDIIFHAAAHKHVPLMELNAPEAITCNVLGTQNLVEMALKHGVKHFVMISTDKAVNPTNIMGASKRVAEMLVLQAASRGKCPYVVVRFGNVLGSRGSVIPTFQRQIAAGGPITVTHPEVCRYFMTIPEAVQLVLQSAVVGQGGEVMMLDMGQPVKIVDLAKNLIRLSGYQVGKDIEITFSGLRPGEKLYEELFIAGETYESTQHEKIRIVRNASHQVPMQLETQVAELIAAAQQDDSRLIRQLLQKLVTGYVPDTARLTSDERPYSAEPALHYSVSA